MSNSAIYWFTFVFDEGHNAGAMLALNSSFYVPLAGDGATNSSIGSGLWIRVLFFCILLRECLDLYNPLPFTYSSPPLELFSRFKVFCICITGLAFFQLFFHVISSHVVSCPFLIVLLTYVSIENGTWMISKPSYMLA
jgi:hypothetical protein